MHYGSALDSVNSEGFRLKNDDEDEKDTSSTSTAGPPPNSPPITGRFNRRPYGRDCMSERSLTSSYNAHLSTHRQSRHLNSSIFLLASHINTGSPTLGGGREWGKSFIVRPTSSSFQGRGHRFSGVGRNDLDRSGIISQRCSSSHYGWARASQETYRINANLSRSPVPIGNSLQPASLYGGQGMRSRIPFSVSVSRYAMGGSSATTTSTSRELQAALNSLKNYIAMTGKTLITGDDAHPFEIKHGNLLGSGGFAKVFIGLDTVKGELLAIKEMSTENISDVHSLNEIEQEFALLRSISHPKYQLLLF